MSQSDDIYYTEFTSLTRKGLDICPLPTDIRNSCFRGGAGARGGKPPVSVPSDRQQWAESATHLWAVNCGGRARGSVGQAAVAQAWAHGDGRGGTATLLARSATAGRSSVGSTVSASTHYNLWPLLVFIISKLKCHPYPLDAVGAICTFTVKEHFPVWSLSPKRPSDYKHGWHRFPWWTLQPRSHLAHIPTFLSLTSFSSDSLNKYT